jgi:hypothetical protein
MCPEDRLSAAGTECSGRERKGGLLVSKCGISGIRTESQRIQFEVFGLSGACVYASGA